jgi:hypothetical protein
MLRRLFERKPDARDHVFAEAQALLDDGLEIEFVLGLFPEEAGWLRSDLVFSDEVVDAIASVPPSYYFEGSLKSKFIGAGRAAAQPVAPALASPFRTAAASMAVFAAAGLVGVLTLGFVTAGSSVPGDWNYSFKLANERLQYALANGNARVDIQLRTTEARVYELQKLTRSGDVNASDVTSLQRELQALADLASQQPFDPLQQQRVMGLAGTSKVVLDDARATKPALDPSVSAASAAADNAVTTALNPAPVKQLPPVTATPSATPAATGTATATAAPAATATASVTATASATGSASATATATQTTTPAASSSPTATVAPSATPSPSPSPTASATP